MTLFQPFTPDPSKHRCPNHVLQPVRKTSGSAAVDKKVEQCLYCGKQGKTLPSRGDDLFGLPYFEYMKSQKPFILNTRSTKPITKGTWSEPKPEKR